VSSTEEYIARLTAGADVEVDARKLDAEARLGEALFTGLRLTEGVDLEIIRARHGADIWRRYGNELERFVLAGLLTLDGTRMRLTRKGMLLANDVMAVFV
jgi:oxygen-independent coproporphyrinogen-3 oxidase